MRHGATKLDMSGNAEGCGVAFKPVPQWTVSHYQQFHVWHRLDHGCHRLDQDARTLLLHQAADKDYPVRPPGYAGHRPELTLEIDAHGHDAGFIRANPEPFGLARHGTADHAQARAAVYRPFFY